MPMRLQAGKLSLEYSSKHFILQTNSQWNVKHRRKSTERYRKANLWSKNCKKQFKYWQLSSTNARMCTGIRRRQTVARWLIQWPWWRGALFSVIFFQINIPTDSSPFYAHLELFSLLPCQLLPHPRLPLLRSHVSRSNQSYHPESIFLNISKI